jgi:hypothetical protein
MVSIGKVFKKAGKLAGKVEKNVKYAETKQIVAGLFGVAVESFEQGRAQAKAKKRDPVQLDLFDDA